VVFASEFGRAPWSQNTTGRDHNGKGFVTLLAGGGVKGGVVEGATDEVGYEAWTVCITSAICRPLSSSS